MDIQYRSETKHLTPETRATLPDSYIELSDGFTQYELGGPEEGEVCVLVHGFSVPYFVWDETFSFLTELGFRVLRYNLFGRGFSDRPRLENTIDLFDRQLFELLDVLQITKSVNLFGLSTGGVITSNFIIRHPERVKRLVLIDPAGFPPKNNTLIKFFLWKPLGDLIFKFVGDKGFRRMAVNMFGQFAVEMLMEQYMAQMEYKGFRYSLLSTIRSGILDDNLEIYQKIGEMELPILLIWGEEDETIPFEYSPQLVEAIPQIEFYPIAGAGHVPQLEQPVVVNPLIACFLSLENERSKEMDQ